MKAIFVVVRIRVRNCRKTKVVTRLQAWDTMYCTVRRMRTVVCKCYVVASHSDRVNVCNEREASEMVQTFAGEPELGNKGG